MAIHTSDRKRSVRGKIMAILAGGAIIGLGTTATLAAWTDTEWVFGGNAAGDGPGLGTSNFEVEQDVSAGARPFVQDETNPGQALTFGLDALSLELGQSVYAPVALRTVAGSGAGDLTLQPAVPADATVITTNDTNNVLWNALQVRVWASATSFTCTTAPDAATATLVTDGPLNAPPVSTTQSLAANTGNTMYYCFEVTLPTPVTPQEIADAELLQGRGIAPAWEFSAVSV